MRRNPPGGRCTMSQHVAIIFVFIVPISTSTSTSDIIASATTAETQTSTTEMSFDNSSSTSITASQATTETTLLETQTTQSISGGPTSTSVTASQSTTETTLSKTQTPTQSISDGSSSTSETFSHSATETTPWVRQTTEHSFPDGSTSTSAAVVSATSAVSHGTGNSFSQSTFSTFGGKEHSSSDSRPAATSLYTTDINKFESSSTSEIITEDVETTSKTPSLTTTELPLDYPDFYKPDLDHSVYRILIAGPFQMSFRDNLNNPNTVEYKQLSLDVIYAMTPLFYTDPAPEGFVRTTVNGFHSLTEFENSLNVTMATTSSDNETVANYTAEYSMSSLPDNDSVIELFHFLTQEFVELTSNVTIGRQPVNKTFLSNYSAYLENTEKEKLLQQVADPCATGEDLCHICYKCTMSDKQPICEAKCKSSDNLLCSLNAVNDTAPVCLCQENYLHLAGSCVNQNIIIGIASGIGGALIVGFVIGIVILFLQNRRNKSDRTSQNLDSFGMYIPSFGSTADHPVEFHRLSDVTLPVEPIDPLVKMMEKTESYKNFKASLSHIDPTVDYFADRPQVILRM